MIRFGVIGAGNIANTFSEAIQKGELDAELYAIASRSLEKAQSYQKKYDFKRAYGSYKDLYIDPLVDVIYLATPHGLHYEKMLDIIKNNKHILCEKSFTLNHKQASEIFAKAKEKNLFIMDAVWTRFLPVIKELQDQVESGIIGQIKQIQADFCFKADKPDHDRLFNKNLGGGALLDVGIYPITFANLFLGKPSHISSRVNMYPTGVDAEEDIHFSYKDAHAELKASLIKDQPLIGYIKGSKGYIEVDNFFFTEKARIYSKDGQLIKTIENPHKVNGFEYEIEETIHAIKHNQLESRIMPHKETLSILKQMDYLRSSWGFTYPNEKEED